MDESGLTAKAVDLIEILIEPKRWAGLPMLMLATFALTQAVKMTTRMWFRQPCKRTIQAAGLLVAGIATYGIIPLPAGGVSARNIAFMVCVAGIGWIGSVSIHDYGFRVLKAFFPRLAAVLGSDRREADFGPPTDSPDRRAKP